MGRNEPCWCGSGNKYKFCHLTLERQDRPRPHTIESSVRRRARVNRCMSAPDGFGQRCSGQIIGAHTISRASSLRAISRDGHVYGVPVHRGFSEIEASGGVFELRLEGINKLSTFNGFCSAHDNKIFEKIDGLHSVIDADFCNRIAYRSVCKELYLKEQLQVLEKDLQLFEAGRDGDEQREVREDLKWYNRGMAAAVNELRGYKRSLEMEVEGGGAWRHLVTYVEGSMPVLASAPLQPLKLPRNGEVIQEFTQDGRPLQNVILNYIVRRNGGAIIFSLRNEDEVASGFVDDVQKMVPEVQLTYMVGLAFEVFENLAVRPEWWEGLSDRGRSLLNEAANRGANTWSQPNECAPLRLLGVVDPGINFIYYQDL